VIDENVAERARSSSPWLIAFLVVRERHCSFPANFAFAMPSRKADNRNHTSLRSNIQLQRPTASFNPVFLYLFPYVAQVTSDKNCVVH